MAPEFEEAAKELLGKVRFVKLDTDLDPDIAQRLNIMGLPTLLFLDKFEPKEGEENAGARAVLKGRVEGEPIMS
jgi:thiol-disulfide isomerase/thioredoxin